MSVSMYEFAYVYMYVCMHAVGGYGLAVVGWVVVFVFDICGGVYACL